MPRLHRIALGLALLALAGCASRQSAPKGSLDPCVPTGVASPSTWTQPVARAVTLMGEDDLPVAAQAVRYLTPRGPIEVWWVEAGVVAIDPAYGDKSVPALYDEGMATAEGYLIAGGTPTCRWKAFGPTEARG